MTPLDVLLNAAAEVADMRNRVVILEQEVNRVSQVLCAVLRASGGEVAVSTEQLTQANWDSYHPWGMRAADDKVVIFESREGTSDACL
jgi:hypothetical protein